MGNTNAAGKHVMKVGGYKTAKVADKVVKQGVIGKIGFKKV